MEGPTQNPHFPPSDKLWTLPYMHFNVSKSWNGELSILAVCAAGHKHFNVSPWGKHTHKESIKRIFLLAPIVVINMSTFVCIFEWTQKPVVFEPWKVKTINGINRIHTAIFTFKYELGLLSSGFDNKFDKNQNVHHYNTGCIVSLTAFKFQSI